jgi:hypothetical protein
VTDPVTTLYRLHDAEGRLLYVGISSSGGRRLEQHAYSKAWWHEVAAATFEEFPTREAAAAAELQAIRDENPRHNIAGRLSGGKRRHRQMAAGKPSTLQIRDFPKDLHKAVRIAATEQGIPIREFVAVALTEKLERLKTEEDAA